jgi:nucleoside-diphosphate-sugar epimerase
MILITGGTGFIGNRLVKRLIEKNQKVRCLVLKEDKGLPLISDSGAEIVYGDILNVKSIEDSLDNVRVVLHLAALVGSPNQELCMKINAGGTRNVIEACRNKGVKRIIAMTSVAATFHHLGAYGRSKLESEKMLLASGLDVTLIRPTLVYAKGGLEFEKVAGFVRKLPVIPMVGGGNALKQPVYVDDVVSLIISVLESKDSSGRIYSAGGPDIVTFNRFVKMIGQELGQKKPIVHVPKFLVYPAAKIIKMVLKNPPITPDQVLEIDEDATVDNTETIIDFCYRPRRLREGLRQSLR